MRKYYVVDNIIFTNGQTLIDFYESIDYDYRIIDFLESEVLNTRRFDFRFNIYERRAFQVVMRGLKHYDFFQDLEPERIEYHEVIEYEKEMRVLK